MDKCKSLLEPFLDSFTVKKEGGFKKLRYLAIRLNKDVNSYIVTSVDKSVELRPLNNYIRKVVN